MNGTTAEWRIGALLKNTKCVRRITPSRHNLLAVACPERIKVVNDHVWKEEGHSLHDASPRLILDKLWATDFLIVHKGYRVAIDLTINESKAESKLIKLKELWSIPPLDIDALCVWVLDPREIPASLDNALAYSHESRIVYL